MHACTYIYLCVYVYDHVLKRQGKVLGDYPKFYIWDEKLLENWNKQDVPMQLILGQYFLFLTHNALCFKPRKN